MKIVIATVQSLFVRGGAEIHAESLRAALRAEGHDVEIVAIPFKWYPPERILDQMLSCRLLDLTESDGDEVDRVIGLKFPAYLVTHPNKVLWILHQHRPAYDLWDHPLGDLHLHPSGAQARAAIRHADQRLIPEARAVFANSQNVCRRLQHYCGIESTPLYHPPKNADQFYCAEASDYLFFPSRLSPNKRQRLVLEALARTRHPVRVCFASSANHSEYAQKLMTLAHELDLGERAVFLGEISEEEKRAWFAHARAVIYPPIDEDYGYVTLEAMLSAKPVLTCTDSGGPLEFVQQRETGLVVEPVPEVMAEAMDELWEKPALATALGRAGRANYDGFEISWPNVVARLLA
ncbi:MAG TPA: glycosyltransferase family 4 protein [Chloroflexota bacterium]|nr:glycosyltransferase family 4 protein [Chloroflexota bacterium]